MLTLIIALIVNDLEGDQVKTCTNLTQILTDIPIINI